MTRGRSDQDRGGRRPGWMTLLCVACAFAVAAAAPAVAGMECGRIVAIGDLHGGIDGFRALLDETAMIGPEGEWADPDVCLVQLGDLVDRAPRSRELLDLVMELERRHRGRVRVLLGNHEVMNMTGDLRYTLAAEFAAFAADETEEERAAGLEAFRRRDDVAQLTDESAIRALFEQRHPPGWFAHRRAFSLEGEYGQWLIERPTAVRIGRSLFVHGGLSPEEAKRGLERINRTLREELQGFLTTRRELVEAGVIHPLADYTEGFYQAKDYLDRRTQNGQDVTMDAASRNVVRLIGYLEASFVREDGPLWYRDHCTNSELSYASRMEATLSELAVRRMVVGHTTQKSHRIRQAHDGGLFVIDTGAGPEYGGHAAALEIVGDDVRAIYPGEHAEPLADPFSHDAGMERYLREANVLERREIGSGVTKPFVLELELEGYRKKAAFKTLHDTKFGLTRMDGGGAEANFSDSFRYEIAAYRLDRLLGLRLVPVAVRRTLDGDDGAVVEWIEEVINEKERRDRNWKPDDPARLVAQQGLMRLFDALIYNADRHLANILIRTTDGSLHPIDHSRAFRNERKLPAAYVTAPASLPRALLPRLKSLDMETLRREMDGLLTKAQLRGILVRRDRLLEKIEKDRRSYGDEVVFQDPEAR